MATRPISKSTLPFQGYPPFLAKFLVPLPPPHPQVTQFLEVPNPACNKRERGGGGGGGATLYSYIEVSDT